MSDAGNKFLIFYIDDKVFSISFDDIIQIIPYEPPRKIPDFPDYALGTIVYEGVSFTVISLRKRFGYPDCEMTGRECVVICDSDKRVGLLCDSISDFRQVESYELYPPPDVNEQVNVRFLKGMFLFRDKFFQTHQCFVISPDLVIRSQDDEKFEKLLTDPPEQQAEDT